MTKCNGSKACSSKKKFKYASWLPAFAIALMPKCPLCLIAYSGAFSLVTGTVVVENLSFYFLLPLGVLCILGIALNYKGQQTRQALVISCAGLLGLAYSHFVLGAMLLNYGFLAVLIFGIWYNGSFPYFYRKYFARYFNKKHTNNEHSLSK